MNLYAGYSIAQMVQNQDYNEDKKIDKIDEALNYFTHALSSQEQNQLGKTHYLMGMLMNQKLRILVQSDDQMTVDDQLYQVENCTYHFQESLKIFRKAKVSGGNLIKCHIALGTLFLDVEQFEEAI